MADMGDRDNRADREDRGDWVKQFWKAKNGITDSLTHRDELLRC